MKETRWIVVRNWDRFQHYRNRQPPWIKNYTELLHDPAYLELAPGTRSLLHGLWLVYASSRARIPLDTRWITRQLNLRCTRAQLEKLNHAGFIEFAASTPLADRYQDASATRAREEADKEETTSPKKELAPKPARPRDELWDALTKALGHEPETDSERGRRNKALKELRAAHATPTQILERSASFRQTWPNLTLTETGLAAHWARFANGAQPPPKPRRYGRGVTAAEVFERAGVDTKELNP